MSGGVCFTLEMVIMFLTEMRTVSKIRHPNIISIMGAVVDVKEPMLVMEYMFFGTLNLSDSVYHLQIHHAGSLSDVLHNESLLLDGIVTLGWSTNCV